MRNKEKRTKIFCNIKSLAWQRILDNLLINEKKRRDSRNVVLEKVQRILEENGKKKDTYKED